VRRAEAWPWHPFIGVGGRRRRPGRAGGDGNWCHYQSGGGRENVAELRRGERGRVSVKEGLDQRVCSMA
jgi:hypothetical protein